MQVEVRSVLREVGDYRHRVQELLGSFEPAEVTGAVAAEIVAEAEILVRSVSSLKLMAAGRVEVTGLFETRGHRSAGPGWQR